MTKIKEACYNIEIIDTQDVQNYQMVMVHFLKSSKFTKCYISTQGIGFSFGIYETTHHFWNRIRQLSDTGRYWIIAEKTN